MVKASVIIITKNNEKHIANLLKALAYQDFKNFEVIIVDLCSTDMTLANAKPFPVKAFRLGPNENISRALNLTCQTSIGEVVFCLKGNNLPQKAGFISNGIKIVGLRGMALTYGPKFRENEAPIVKLIDPEIWRGLSEEIRIIEPKQIKDINFDACAFKKNLWEKVPFPENNGTALWQWSFLMMNQGLKISFNSHLAVLTREKTGLINFFREKRKKSQQFKIFIEREKSELSH